MGIEQLELDVEPEPYDVRLNAQDDDTDVGVVVVPGAGHGPFGDVFDVISYELAGAGARVLRYETWQSREELEAKTLAELHREVEAAVERLRAEGCSTIRLLAKSFGGGVALSRVPDAVERVMLWAPAVEIDVDPDDATGADDRIGDGDSVLLGISDLDHVDVPVRILLGEEDRIPLDHCRRIADGVGDGEVIEIPGENHGFNLNRTAVVEHTLDFLAPDP